MNTLGFEEMYKGEKIHKKRLHTSGAAVDVRYEAPKSLSTRPINCLASLMYLVCQDM